MQRPGEPPVRRQLVSSALLAALRRAGTRHVYGDTADVEELDRTLAAPNDAILAEVDGNTVNQPLVRKVLERILDEHAVVRAAADALRDSALSTDEQLPWIYAVVCARIGGAMRMAFAVDRPWETSLQLHMALGSRPEEALRIGRFVHANAPGAFVKVPFRPDRPDCLLVARDLERSGVPVNLTSTFSARQVAVAALFANATRTNVFLGRIEEGLEAPFLGEYVVLEAQRMLDGLRRRDAVKTELIAASLRDWKTLQRLAGCDVFTAPCSVLKDFLAQDEVPPEALADQRDSSRTPSISKEIREKVGLERIARLHTVEPELLTFLGELRRRPDFEDLADADELVRIFDAAGFGDLFHDPSRRERAEAQAAKLPKLDGMLIERVPLDTHYSLLANEDFQKHQQAIDSEIEKRL